MQIDIKLGARDEGTRATVTATVRRWGFLKTVTVRQYVCFGGGPIRGGQWADAETGEEVGMALESKLNRAAQAAVIRKKLTAG